ncbi:MAG: antibiotic biosynthesis monooxygenase [Roseovarius sp.]
MVIEIANFQLAPGKTEAFFNAMDQAAVLLRAAEGYLDHTVGIGIESPETATLIVVWRSYADHVELFEPSEPHEQFIGMLDGLYEGEISVVHVEAESPQRPLSLSMPPNDA